MDDIDDVVAYLSSRKQLIIWSSMSTDGRPLLSWSFALKSPALNFATHVWQVLNDIDPSPRTPLILSAIWGELFPLSSFETA